MGLMALIFSASPAFAHSAERGFVLLLPTGFIIAGGAAVVALTFVIMAMLRDDRMQALFACEKPLFRLSLPTPPLRVFAALLFIVILVLGINGSNDPARNILPLTVWVGFWVIIVLLHPVIGNLWQAVNPFALLPSKPEHKSGWGGWAALLLFAGFAWFQLVYPAPENPSRLATALLLYAGFTVFACLMLGANNWLRHGDPFAIFLRMLSRTAPLRWTDGRAALQVPGAGLVKEPSHPMGVTFLVIFALAAISFDALAATFTWLSTWAINPFEFAGRTAMMGINTMGLVGSFLLLLVVLCLVTQMGLAWSGHRAPLGHMLGRFTLAMLPISVAFHFSHYLTELLVNGQYLVLAWLNALGLAGDHEHVTTSFLNTASGAWTIYTIQTSAIVVGHVISIAVAHAMALDEGLRGRAALKLEAPMAVLMVAYTGFGLWLLSTPTIA